MEIKIAYICMEYGLRESLHTYAGGLGILAGDVLKGARDLGLPMVGVGILWRHNYTTQLVGEHGWPYDVFLPFRYDFLEDAGVRVTVTVRGRPVRVQAWCVRSSEHVPLYLLDTDLPENHEQDRWITAHLYGGGPEERVAQEMVLGIGGVRALRALGYRPQVYHLNEGHGVLAALALVEEAMAEGASFGEAWAAARRQVVFTTHTPVPAGNESHSLELLMGMGAHLGLTREQLAAIGGDPFNMTVAGLRLARAANAVSRRHGETARAMWAHVDGAAPIAAITNGVHPATWQDAGVAAASTPEALWEAHQAAKRALIEAIYDRAAVWLDPQVLLLGFARRATAYKRPDLLFRHPERIWPLLESGRLNVVLSAKAHPRDEDGKRAIARLVEMSRRCPEHVVFLPNYDMGWGLLLTRGCDVWLNNPVPPQEACGTSGMKAAMNGVLNLSIPDGWWAEAGRHGENGWVFGGEPGGPEQDDRDAAALYDLLSGQVMPLYYEDRPGWLRMMRASIDSVREAYSIHRTLREYCQQLYGL